MVTPRLLDIIVCRYYPQDMQLSRLAEEAEAAEPGAGPGKLAKAKARYGKASEQVRPGGADGRSCQRPVVSRNG